MSTTLKNYDWLKEFPLSVFQLDEKPLFGNTPPFPWEEFSASIVKTFNLNDIKIEPVDMQWREPDTLLSGIGAKPVSYSILFSEIEGALYWIMPTDQIEKLMTLMLSAPSNLFTSIEADFSEGFYYFILSQVLSCINSTKSMPHLGASLEEKKNPPLEPAFCIDISFCIQEQNFKGRLLVVQALKNSWKEKFAERKLDFVINHPLVSKIFVPIHLEIGKTELLPSELKQLSAGDYLLLDSCSYEPDLDKGRLMMTLDGKPLFRAKLKQGTIKILEFPLYQEDMTMKEDEDEKEDHDEDDESEFEDYDLDTDLEDDEEDNTEDETFSEELEEDETHSHLEDLHEPIENSPKKEINQKELLPKTDSPEKTKTTKSNIADLPVNIIIEIGRIQLSIQKLMELQPGNMLEVDLHPENGVDLVINGKRIGKGELLRVGETLGVRILDIG